MHNTAFLLLLFCSLLLLLDLVLSLVFAHLKVEPERHKATVPSFSSSSAFCCCCLKAFCPSSSHTSRWSLTDTKQNMLSCCSIHLCGQNTVHESCMKADTCHLTLLTLPLLPHVCSVPPHRISFCFANASQGDNNLIPQPANNTLQIIYRARACAFPPMP